MIGEERWVRQITFLVLLFWVTLLMILPTSFLENRDYWPTVIKKWWFCPWSWTKFTVEHRVPIKAFFDTTMDLDLFAATWFHPLCTFDTTITWLCQRCSLLSSMDFNTKIVMKKIIIGPSSRMPSPLSLERRFLLTQPCTYLQIRT